MRAILPFLWIFLPLHVSAQWMEHILEETETWNPHCIKMGDLDGDGDGDIVVCSYNDNRLVWYELLTPGVFSECQVILDRPDMGMNAFDLVDLDGDQDLDILGTWDRTWEVGWLANNGNATFGNLQVIDSNQGNGYWRSVLATDIDGDGDQDAVSMVREGSPRFAWYPNDGSGVFGAYQSITSTINDPKNVRATDVEGDGDLDLVVRNVSTFVWFRNNGLGSFNGPNTIATVNLTTQEPIEPGDLDGDGDTDLVFGSSGSTMNLLWTANINGSYNAQQITAGSTVAQMTALRTGDLDGDGDLDVVAGGVEALAWHANDGLGNLGPPIVLADSCTYCFLTRWLELGDIDTDGDLDIAFTGSSTSFVGYVENLGGGSFAPMMALDTSESRPLEVVVADLDGDGDHDIVRSSTIGPNVAWLTNQGGGVFDPALPIGYEDVIDRDLRAVDLDGDQVLDLLAVWDNIDSAAVQWSAGLGDGLYAAPVIITDTMQAPRAAAPADLDQDGDLDVVIISESTALLVPNEGNGSFGQAITIPVNGAPVALALGDVDGDLFDDLVIAYDTDGVTAIALFPNTGGGAFGPGQSLSNTLAAASSMHLRDLDGDGDRDLLLLQGEALHTLWNSSGTLGPANQLVIEPDTISTYAIGDLDGDGLPDLLTCGMDPDLAVRMHMNDGNGGFIGAWPISSALEDPLDLITGDLDADGDADVLAYRYSLGGLLSWFENPGLVTGLSTPVHAGSLRAWPNPFSGLLCITSATMFDTHDMIHVVDAVGREVLRTTGNGTARMELRTDGLAAGHYTVFVVREDSAPQLVRVVAL